MIIMIKFKHLTKGYMQKPELVLKNKSHEILWDFEIQMDHLIPVRRPHLEKITCH